MIEFGKLNHHRYDVDGVHSHTTITDTAYELTEANQSYWGYLRTLFNFNFTPYYKDGVFYVWHPIIINSNAVAIANTSNFDFNRSEECKYYMMYK